MVHDDDNNNQYPSYSNSRRKCSFRSHFRLDSKSFSRVHTQSAGSSSEAVAFWPIFLAIAWFAVDFIHVNGHRCAVQVLLTDHLQGKEQTQEETFEMQICTLIHKHPCSSERLSVLGMFSTDVQPWHCHKPCVTFQRRRWHTRYVLSWLR